ncbi:MAG: hypothetical protein RIS26_519 [Actinomycetota bacterium]
MNFVYLTALLVSLAGLVTLDFRYRLAFSVRPKAAAIAIGIPYVLFVIWDFCGINLGIFFKGQSAYLTGIMLAPDFPIEELFFLALLCYSTLIIATWFERVKK